MHILFNYTQNDNVTKKVYFCKLAFNKKWLKLQFKIIPKYMNYLRIHLTICMRDQLLTRKKKNMCNFFLDRNTITRALLDRRLGEDLLCPHQIWCTVSILQYLMKVTVKDSCSPSGHVFQLSCIPSLGALHLEVSYKGNLKTFFSILTQYSVLFHSYSFPHPSLLYLGP